jgi:uncharacterized protein (TIGR04255 family)
MALTLYMRYANTSIVKAKYSKAPVSEVILGVTFAGAELDTDIVFLAQTRLAEKYTTTEIRPPLASESMVDFRLATEMEPHNTGPFLLRMRTPDHRWLCQIQKNKIYLNWIRSDEEPVGHYVGFTAILAEFLFLCAQLGVTEESMETPRVSYFDLTYHDRVEWQSYVDDVSDLERIMNFRPPFIGGDHRFNNVFSRYTHHIPQLGGYGILSMNTDTSPQSTQLLKFENSARGVVTGLGVREWMDRANAFQVESFEHLFKKELLDKWR